MADCDKCNDTRFIAGFPCPWCNNPKSGVKNLIAPILFACAIFLVSCEKTCVSSDQTAFDDAALDTMSVVQWPEGYCTSEVAWWEDKVLIRQAHQWEFDPWAIYQDGFPTYGRWSSKNCFRSSESSYMQIYRTLIVQVQNGDTLKIYFRAP